MIPDHDQSRALAAFIQIATLLSTTQDLQLLLERVVTSARQITHAEAGSVYVLDRTKRHLYVEVSQNDVVTTPVPSQTRIPLVAQGKRNLSHLCSYCAITGKLISIPDIYRYSGLDFQSYYESDRQLRYRTQSMVAVPLRNHEELTIGVLELANMRDFNTGELQALPLELESVIKAFAAQAAVAVTNVQLLTENQHLLQQVGRDNRTLEQENRVLRDQINDQSRFATMVGRGPAMQQVFDLMRKVFDSDATVLLRGETGTGKELVATTIHQQSPRHGGNLVVQNCAAMPEDLLESEFFGYRRGAFTGAARDKKGLLEIADGGTLFLDEIGDMPLGMQAKLLRVLQEGEMRPLGDVQSKNVNVRFIAATHRDLQDMVAAGTFREDLYYRLCVFPIDIPPLRQRKEDLPALLNHFLERCAKQYQKIVSGFTKQSLECLVAYDYPGNIRELQNIIERAVLLCEPEGSVELDHLPGHIVQVNHAPLLVSEPNLEQQSLSEMVRLFESSVIEQKLQELRGNQTKTAHALNVSRRTLIEKMNRYKIKVEK